MRFRKAAQILASALIVAASAPAAAGEFAPVCADGRIRYVLINFDSDTHPSPGGDQGGCHAPCIKTRKMGMLLKSDRG